MSSIFDRSMSGNFRYKNVTPSPPAGIESGWELNLEIQGSIPSLGVAFFTTGPSWVLKCISF